MLSFFRDCGIRNYSYVSDTPGQRGTICISVFVCARTTEQRRTGDKRVRRGGNNRVRSMEIYAFKRLFEEITSYMSSKLGQTSITSSMENGEVREEH